MSNSEDEVEKTNCEECRYFRILRDGTKRCRNKKAIGLRRGKCPYFRRRWPFGIQIPDLKEPL